MVEADLRGLGRLGEAAAQALHCRDAAPCTREPEVVTELLEDLDCAECGLQ